jgi:hypothetical protein
MICSCDIGIINNEGQMLLYSAFKFAFLVESMAKLWAVLGDDENTFHVRVSIAAGFSLCSSTCGVDL